VGRNNIFKPTIVYKRLHQDINDTGVRIVNFATSKNLVINSMKFPAQKHSSIYLDLSWWQDSQADWAHIDRQEMAFKYTRYIIFQKSWLWYWSLSGGWKVTERLAVIKQATHKFEGDRFNLRKLSQVNSFGEL